MSQHEFRQNNSSCNYNSLSSYCNCATNMAPVPSQVPSQATVVVPVFGSISYDTLQRSGGANADPNAVGCNGYVSIGQAYDTSGCGSYSSRSCGC